MKSDQFPNCEPGRQTFKTNGKKQNIAAFDNGVSTAVLAMGKLCGDPSWRWCGAGFSGGDCVFLVLLRLFLVVVVVRRWHSVMVGALPR